MSMRRWLTEVFGGGNAVSEAFRDFNAAFSLTAAHDYDLPDEPSAPTASGPWPPRLADTSPLRLVPERVDGLAAPGPTHPGAANHPQTSVVSELRAHNSADRPAPSCTTIASGHGTPQSAGAGHPSQLPLSDTEAAGAAWLATLRTLAARLADAAARRRRAHRPPRPDPDRPRDGRGSDRPGYAPQIEVPRHRVRGAGLGHHQPEGNRSANTRIYRTHTESRGR